MTLHLTAEQILDAALSKDEQGKADEIIMARLGLTDSSLSDTAFDSLLNQLSRAASGYRQEVAEAFKFDLDSDLEAFGMGKPNIPLRPYSIVESFSSRPTLKGTSGDIETTALRVPHGIVQFNAELQKSPFANGTSNWLKKWTYLYVLPQIDLRSTISYSFRFQTRFFYFTQTKGENTAIAVHLVVSHIPNAGGAASGGSGEIWPAFINTTEPQWGTSKRVHPEPTRLTGSFTANPGSYPAISVTVGFYVVVPPGTVDVTSASHWVGTEFLADNSNQHSWGWIRYGVQPIPVVKP